MHCERRLERQQSNIRFTTVITNITSTATYTLTCTGTGGSGSNSATVTVTGGGGTNPPAPVTPGNQWQLKFFEEFDATDYDHTKLTPCFDWGFGGCTSTFNNGYEHYLPSQVVVGSGIARLIAAPLSPPYADSAATMAPASTNQASWLLRAPVAAGNTCTSSPTDTSKRG